MSAQIIQFLPRANASADRAFWIGKPEQTEQTEQQADEIMNIPLSYDTAPSEYSAPDGDCA